MLFIFRCVKVKVYSVSIPDRKPFCVLFYHLLYMRVNICYTRILTIRPKFPKAMIHLYSVHKKTSYTFSFSSQVKWNRKTIIRNIFISSGYLLWADNTCFLPPAGCFIFVWINRFPDCFCWFSIHKYSRHITPIAVCI